MNPDRLEALLSAAPDLEVLVVGDLMLDRYVSGHVNRVSPEAPVPVVRVDTSESAVGGAGNVAANVTALGARCSVVGCVGEDPAADLLDGALTALQVGVDGVVRDSDRPTTEKTRILAGQHQIVRFDVESHDDVSAEVASELVRRVTDLAQGADAIVVEDYNKGVLVPAVIESVRQVAAVRGIPWIVDPKRRNFFRFQGATVLKPNAHELQDALGDFIHPDDPAWMEDVRSRLECQNLLLTMGARGMALQTAEGASVRVPAVARGVYDVSGAGDTVTALTALVLAFGGSIEEAACLANHAAAIEVGKPGVATVSPNELRSQLAARATT
ncbi:MAG: bifunctional heptose 7-phosphate kinase/heptose 1-phosphate adenyltransferase [Longimicrobiales bacterium]